MSQHMMKIVGICGGLVAVPLGIFAIVQVSDSPDKWIRKHYQTISYRHYHSSKTPARVANEITRKFHPLDRVTDSSGTYLQYQKLVIAVLWVVTGTDITVDDATTGYYRYSGHVGHYWQRPGSGGWNRHGGASFRGGGSGSGK